MTGFPLAKKEPPRLVLSVVLLGLVLIVDASRMLATMFEFSPLNDTLALRMDPLGGTIPCSPLYHARAAFFFLVGKEYRHHHRGTCLA